MCGLPLEGGSEDCLGDSARFGIVTVSDRASGGVYEDQSGPAILQFFHEAIKSKWAAGCGEAEGLCCLTVCCAAWLRPGLMHSLLLSCHTKPCCHTPHLPHAPGGKPCTASSQTSAR